MLPTFPLPLRTQWMELSKTIQDVPCTLLQLTKVPRQQVANGFPRAWSDMCRRNYCNALPCLPRVTPDTASGPAPDGSSRSLQRLAKRRSGNRMSSEEWKKKCLLKSAKFMLLRSVFARSQLRPRGPKNGERRLHEQ